MGVTQTSWFLVYPDEVAPRDRPWGVYRRITEDGRVVHEQAYHPATGWHTTEYWARVKWLGAEENFLVEVDELEARRARAAFDQAHRAAGGLPPVRPDV